MIIKGRVWKFGDGLKSAHFFSGKYDALGRAHKHAELAQHILEGVEDGFASKVQPGDIFVVGTAFGAGKHLNGPIGALRHLGVAAVLAKGFSSVWERDSINLGFPALVYPEVWDRVETGEVLELDARSGQARNLSRGEAFAVKPTDPGILDLLEVGGIAPYTARLLGIPAADAVRPH